MAAKKPLVLIGGQYAQIQTGDFIDIPQGGTGGNTQVSAQTALGLLPGTNVQAYSAELAAVVALAANGSVHRTGTGAYAVRTLATAAAARIVVTNGDGVAGNPTVDLALVTDSGTGSFKKLTIDGYGRVTGTANVAMSDLTGLLGSTYLGVGGGTLTSGTITLFQDPVNPMDAATKQYVDASRAGLDAKDSVRALANTNIATLSAPQTVDGVSLIAGNRVLLTAQTAANQNGVWVVNAGDWTRPTDFVTGKVSAGAFCFVEEGTTNADTGWVLTTNGAVTVDTTTLAFAQYSSSGSITAGNGLTKTGNSLAVNFSTRIVNNGGNLDLQAAVATPGTYTKLTVDTYGRVTGGATAAPADVGAQPANASLTALAALAGTGFVVQTGANTFAERSLTSAGGRLTVSNAGTGVAGNVDLDLPAGVNASGAGTYSSVTVDTYGRVIAGTTGASGNSSTSTGLTNGEATPMVKFQAVYISGADAIKKALANAAGTTNILGFVTTAVASAATGSVITSGEATGTTGEWDTITGQSGGLTTGAVYYLDATTAGKITTTPPGTGFIASVGIARSTTTLIVRPTPTIQL